MYETTDKEVTGAVLVAVYSDTKYDESELDELASLLETAGGQALFRMVQYRPTPDKATYIGRGKLEELRELCQKENIDLVVFDCELTPSQIREIEDAIGDVRVIDRTMLILDIFGRNATTNEGILQVQIARLKYTIPRLRGQGKDLSRLGGGIGTRGPGESKLESDKRHIKTQIASLEEEIRELEKRRLVQRKNRENSSTVQIALAGYTNVGKSTLLNTLTGANILAENKLFATLDPTTRKLNLPNVKDAVITDTVGFIKNLPHHLVEAFKSTLAEVVFADIILVVLDVTSPDVRVQYDVSMELINSLIKKHKVEEKPIIYVFNKVDELSGDNPEEILGLGNRENAVFLSAKTGVGIDTLIETIERVVLSVKREVKFLLPFDKGDLMSMLYKTSKVKEAEYTDEGIVVSAIVDDKVIGQMSKYVI
ncbi:MAG: GTPase HflX [Ruminococcaceae bacterium]|nr:GTPase HflX [Oscillospiraceae bacterium]